jgi:hypothetical protein
LHLAILDFQSGHIDNAQRLLNQLFRAASQRSYTILAARSQWVLALIQWSQGDFVGALRSNEHALDSFMRAGDLELAAFMRNPQLAEVMDYLGNPVRSWAFRAQGFRDAVRLRDSGRFVAMHLVSAHFATDSGWGRAAREILMNAASTVINQDPRRTSDRTGFHIALARAAERIEPGSGVSEIAAAELACSRIADPLLRERQARELARARSEVFASARAQSAELELDATIDWLGKRGASARLPPFHLMRGRPRLLSTLDQGPEGYADVSRAALRVARRGLLMPSCCSDAA